MQDCIEKPATVGGLIRSARKRRRLTQEKAAAWFGCTDRTIKHWEAGRKPHGYWKGPIAKFARVSVARVNALIGCA